MKRRLAAAILIIVACAVMPDVARTQQAAAPAGSQAQAIERIPLERFDVPGTNYETIIARLEAAPHATIGRHTHPGVESGLVLEGEMVLIVAGSPERVLTVGESYQIAPGAIHEGRAGPRGAKVVATFVVEKGKPFASPVK